ncbi:MAG: hypothetical protein M4579_002371 [Chaenotheca gracillima]|nr:MAG: hypothetical protein M4579_002371 [Chaenotheca gracillima]
MEATNITPAAGDTSLYERLEEYPWDSDEEFQGGLNAILGPNPSSEQEEQLTIRARCFYYSRKHDIPVDFDSYKAFRVEHNCPSPVRQQHGSTTTSSANIDGAVSSQAQSLQNGVDTATSSSSPSSDPNAPYPTSFAHVVDLITKGEAVPGIKEIPDTVLTGQESKPTRTQRKKPWEANEDTLPSASPNLGSSAQ